MDGIRSVSQSPQFIQGKQRDATPLHNIDDIPHVAIVKIQNPQEIDDATLSGLAKTLAQLRTLGLLGIVVVDCGPGVDAQEAWLDVVTRQAMRVTKAVNNYGGPLSPVIDSVFAIDHDVTNNANSLVAGRVFVDLVEPLQKTLREGALAVLPPYASSTATSEAQLVDTNELILALTRYFAGLQFSTPEQPGQAGLGEDPTPMRTAAVDRIIVIDPLGGIPSKYRPNGAHIFLNMESEFDGAKDDIESLSSPSTSGPHLDTIKQRHHSNLTLIKSTLSMLPPTSSALLTTPTEAANLNPPDRDASEAGVFGYVGSVGTRRSLNPLIHNLLTDRPVYSSSLPLSRVTTKSKPTTIPSSTIAPPRLSKTTLAKRGMPVTIYPDPRTTPWHPDAPRLRLTDTCVDLPRLVNLINDSFGRKLDVEHYLARVNENIAGIIIAGEYEGGAILTWEKPWEFPSSFPSAHPPQPDSKRLVPYLDKFAVLKRAQGAGGVADVVFNAMVDDCFPRGVCWRSRKDNPVNKWYFERSRGTWKIDETNWAMFWTMGSEVFGGEKGRGRLWDYERVCRGVEPSWADKKAVVD